MHNSSKPMQADARTPVAVPSPVPQLPRFRPIAQPNIAPHPPRTLAARPAAPAQPPAPAAIAARPLAPPPSQALSIPQHNPLAPRTHHVGIQPHQLQHPHSQGGMQLAPGMQLTSVVRPSVVAPQIAAPSHSSQVSTGKAPVRLTRPQLQAPPIQQATSQPVPSSQPQPAPSPNSAMQTPPFLTKLYQLVEDPSTKALVSWTDSNGLSFTVHKPSDFGKDVLPKYFKHNNFSSFVRQLNQYGFHKLNPDRWMFGHDNFQKDRPDLLRNITRRRPKQNQATSSQVVVPPHALAQNRAVVELGNYGLEGEVKSLKRDKDLLIKELVVTRQAEEKLKDKCDNLENRMQNLEQTTKQMQAFIMHYFSQVLQPYSQAVASRKRKRLPASTSSEDVMELVADKPSSDVGTVAQVAQTANPHSLDSLRVMMQQMGVNMARNPAGPPPRAPNQPLAIENSRAEPPSVAYAPATVQELPEQGSEEVIEPVTDVRVQSPPPDPEPMNQDAPNNLGGPTVSFSFLDDLPASPTSGLTMDAIEHALQEPNGHGETLHIDATAIPSDPQTRAVPIHPAAKAVPNGKEETAANADNLDEQPGNCDSQGDERAIEEFLDLADAPLPPPLTHLPEGTDIQALAQRIESFADQPAQ